MIAAKAKENNVVSQEVVNASTYVLKVNHVCSCFCLVMV